jgi:hypothetical protein
MEKIPSFVRVFQSERGRTMPSASEESAYHPCALWVREMPPVYLLPSHYFNQPGPMYRLRGLYALVVHH